MTDNVQYALLQVTMLHGSVDRSEFLEALSEVVELISGGANEGVIRDTQQRPGEQSQVVWMLRFTDLGIQPDPDQIMEQMNHVDESLRRRRRAIPDES